MKNERKYIEFYVKQAVKLPQGFIAVYVIGLFLMLGSFWFIASGAGYYNLVFAFIGLGLSGACYVLGKRRRSKITIDVMAEYDKTGELPKDIALKD